MINWWKCDQRLTGTYLVFPLGAMARCSLIQCSQWLHRGSHHSEWENCDYHGELFCFPKCIFLLFFFFKKGNWRQFREGKQTFSKEKKNLRMKSKVHVGFVEFARALSKTLFDPHSKEGRDGWAVLVVEGVSIAAFQRREWGGPTLKQIRLRLNAIGHFTGTLEYEVPFLGSIERRELTLVQRTAELTLRLPNQAFRLALTALGS